ncbi:cellulase family glycosylhydrolase [Cellulomonas soli]
MLRRWVTAFVAAAAVATSLTFVPAPAQADATPDWLHTDGARIVDENGKEAWLTGTNWFGFNATERVFHGLWTANIRTLTKGMADRGINVVRVPISTQLLLEWKAGTVVTAPNVNTYANPELAGMNNLQIFDYWLSLCDEYGLKVVLDVHSAEADNAGHFAPMWFKGSITTQDVYAGWEWVTARYKDDDTIIGADLKNEPHGTAGATPRAKWDASSDVDNFRAFAQEAARRILAINPHLLILVEGIEVYPKPGVSWSSTNGAEYDGTWWGGNLRGARDLPIDLGVHQDQLVYSPHDYGPLVSAQPWFTGDWNRTTLERDVWDPNWLYLHKAGTAPLLIGEWGGILDGGPNQRWMTALRDLIVERRISHTFWVLNPNSGDTGGLLLDDWVTWDAAKYALLKPALWQEGGKFVSLDHQVPLGGAGSTTGTTIAAVGTGTPTTTPTATPTVTPTPTATPTVTPTPTPTVPVGACSVRYTASSWSSGFTAAVRITNTGTTTRSGWTLGFTFPSGQTLTQGWSATWSQTGSAVQATHLAWNGTLAPGASIEVGFTGTFSGQNSAPTAFTLDGSTCTTS